jgi:TonB family protein
VPLLPSDIPLLVSGVTSGAGVGEGIGDGQGAGTGSGVAGTGLGSGAGARGGEPSLELQFAEWIVKPEYLVPRYYPEEAKEKRSTGTVMLACLVDKENRVHQCKVLKESPRFVGFGKATLRLSRHFRVKPPMVGGMARYDVPVRIPVIMEHR